MAITRTAMIDDDGSGTTGTIINNAWKQELYGQIDAWVGAVAGWTPVDTSGAGLVFSLADGVYCVSGQMVTFWGRVIYPTTSGVQLAKIGGLPFPNTGQYAGAHQTFGMPAVVFHLPPLVRELNLMSPTNGAQHPVAGLSGAQVIFQGAYLKA